MHFWQPCWRNSEWMPKSFCPVCENDIKKSDFFSKKTLLHRLILWRRQREFTQPCRKLFARRSQVFPAQIPKVIINMKLFTEKNFASIGSYGHADGSLQNPAKKLPEGRNLFEHYPKKITLKKLEKSFTFKRCSGQVEGSFFNLVKRFLKDSRIILQNPKTKNKLFSSGRILLTRFIQTLRM